MSHRVRVLRPLVLVLGALLLSTPAAEAKDKFDKAVREAINSGSQHHPVILTANAGARGKIRAILQACGVTASEEFASIDAISADVPASCLAQLLKHTKSIGSNARITANQLGDPTSSSLYEVTDGAGLPYTLRDTLGVSPYSTGAGIGIAVIDSGIAPLPGLAGRITAFYDFTNGSSAEAAPSDGYGHGTHVAALIGADDLNHMGVAPGVHFVGFKVLDAYGAGYTSDVIRALEFATANRAELNLRIVNLSLGHPILAPAADDPLVQAVESAVRAGLIVTVSAGNRGTNPITGEVGYAGISSPGNAPSAITSGAVDTKETANRSDDSVAKYSSRGPTWLDGFAKPDVVAPGHKLVSLTDSDSYLYQNYPQFRRSVDGQAYLALSGTSMASAVTAGVVATMLESYQWYAWYATEPPTPTAIKAMLQYSALPVLGVDGMPVDGLTQGTGGINAEGAMRIASNVSWLASAAVDPYMGAFDPAAFLLDPYLLYPVSSIGTESPNWASKVIWGPQVVLATNLIWGTNVVWGDNIVWGDNVVWGDNIVWGDNVVWGDNIVWGESFVYGESIVGGASPGRVGHGPPRAASSVRKPSKSR